MRKLITFASAEYRNAAERLVASARPFFDECRIYTPRDLSAEFYAKHARHFEHRRGMGYWVWKPHFILRELEQMPTHGQLMYCDSQCVLESDPAPLFSLAKKHDGIGLFHQRREGHKNRSFTRRACFRKMNCDEPRFWNGDNLATTYSVWTKTIKAIKFLRGWLSWCSDYEAVSDETSPDNLPDFIDHRHDQSIASILAIRDNLFTLCDASQWGDGYRCCECQYPRIISVQRSVVSPWIARPDMSSIVEVSTVGTCPLRCTFCPQDKLDGAYNGPKELSLETFAKCLDNTMPGDAMYFAGFTEPCIHPKIVELLQMCIDRGHRVRLYTTGRGLDAERAKLIASMPIEQIFLHLPDADGALSHSERNVAVLEALASAKDARCMTMNDVPHDAVGAVWRKLVKGTGAMHDRAGNLAVEINVPRRKLTGAIRCGAAPSLDHPVLLPDGRLSLCCCDYSLAHIVGDLSTTPLTLILRSEEIQRVLHLQRSGEGILCRNCAYAEAIA